MSLGNFEPEVWLNAAHPAARHGVIGLDELVGMVRARADRSAFAATAALVWTGDLPRQLQQVLFDTADGIAI